MNSQPKVLEDAELFARRAVSAAGHKAIKLEPIIGLGAVNHVFVADIGGEKWVVRFHINPLDTDDYAKEEWCLTAARRAGVPVPGFVCRGSLDGEPYIVQSFVEGRHADHHRSRHLWRTLGEYGKRIAEIDLDSAPDSLFPRFGRDPRANWKQHMAYNIGALTPDDRLIALGVYEPSGQAALVAAFQELGPRVENFGLAHGDLVPKNALLPSGGPPVVIDWGSSHVDPTPFDAILRIRCDPATEGFTGQDLEDFAEGFGVDLVAIEPILSALHLLNRLDVVRWALGRRPDRIPDTVASAKAAVDRFFRTVDAVL